MTSQSKMEDYQPEIPNNKLICLLDVKKVMETRTVISEKSLGKSYYLIVDQITSEIPFLDKFKSKIVISTTPERILYRKTVFCRSFTIKEIEDEESKRYLIEAYEFEKQKNFKEADLGFRSYLKKVQFRFTLSSKSNIYNLIKAGHTIIGSIDKYRTDRGQILTVESSSVHYK